MSHDIRAIFDNGVFRPLEKLEIPDGTCVHLRVDEEYVESTMAAQATPVELQHQNAALQAILQDVDRLPQTARNDGLSGRDHDYILYGIQK